MNAQTEVGKEIVNVSRDLGESVGNVISVMADKLSVPAEHVYRILVKQQVIEGVTYLVFSLFGAICFFALALLCWKIIKGKERDYYDGGGRFFDAMNEAPGWVLSFVGCCIVFVGSMLFLTIGGSSAVGQIINPEYYAIKDIAEMAKEIIK